MVASNPEATDTQVRLLHVVGARPNFIKVAPIMRAVEAWPESSAELAKRVHFSQTLVHTGQHYDAAMSDVFFTELDLPKPDHYLGVGSGTHAAQTAEVLRRLEPVLDAEQPNLVVVVGDVNSTLAAALCAAKLHIPVTHVEAGLRSGDRAMPEELNRLVVDHLATLLFTTCEEADDNLRREGVDESRIHFVGNTMIDTLDWMCRHGDVAAARRRLRLEGGEYALATLHRPSNVDSDDQLNRMIRVLQAVSAELPVVFPVHRRTLARLAKNGLEEAISANPRMVITEPLGYRDFVGLMAGARLVLTDSGGVQEETTILGVPCLTLRTTTERAITISEGSNRLVDPTSETAMIAAAMESLATSTPGPGTRPHLWDGRAAERIVEVVARWSVDPTL